MRSVAGEKPAGAKSVCRSGLPGGVRAKPQAQGERSRRRRVGAPAAPEAATDLWTGGKRSEGRTREAAPEGVLTAREARQLLADRGRGWRATPSAQGSQRDCKSGVLAKTQVSSREAMPVLMNPNPTGHSKIGRANRGAQQADTCQLGRGAQALRGRGPQLYGNCQADRNLDARRSPFTLGRRAGSNEQRSNARRPGSGAKKSSGVSLTGF